MGVPRTVPSPAGQRDTSLAAIFGGLILGMLLSSSSITIVAPAMPRIVAELGGLEHYSWIAVSALLASTIVVPIVGKLSDLYGRKPFYVGGIGIFLLGSIMAGLAPNFPALVAARIVQGVGVGTMQPLSQAIIGDLVPPRDRGKYQGMLAATFGVASVAGPLVGGVITDSLTWRWLFFINLPLGLVAFGFIIPFMRLPHQRREHAIDFGGMATLSTGLTALLLATVWGGTQFAWTSPQIVGLVAGGVAALAWFAAIERRAVEPVLPFHLWRSGIFTFANIANMAVAMLMNGAIYFIPVFVQGVIGTNATSSGAVLIPLSLGMVASSIAGGQLVSRTGRYKWQILGGLASTGVGFALLTLMDRGTTSATVVRNMVIIGLGIGAAIQVYTLVVQNAVRREDMGVATATTQLFRSLGSTLGTALLGTIQTQVLLRELPRILPPEALVGNQGAALATMALNPARLASLPPPILDGVRDALVVALHQVFLACLPIVLVAFVASLCIKELPLRRTVHDAPDEGAHDDGPAQRADGPGLPRAAEARDVAD